MDYPGGDNLSRKDVLKDACARFGDKSKYKRAKLYNKKGIEIMDSDIQFMQPGDIYYLAMDGKHH